MESKHTEASFSAISTDSLCFIIRVAQMPISRDLAVFVPTDDNRQTDCFTPCACARGNKLYIQHNNTRCSESGRF